MCVPINFEGASGDLFGLLLFIFYCFMFLFLFLFKTRLFFFFSDCTSLQVAPLFLNCILCIWEQKENNRTQNNEQHLANQFPHPPNLQFRELFFCEKTRKKGSVGRHLWRILLFLKRKKNRLTPASLDLFLGLCYCSCSCSYSCSYFVSRLYFFLFSKKKKKKNQLA